MTVKFLNRGFFQRIFGVPSTPKPANPPIGAIDTFKIESDGKRLIVYVGS